MLRVCVEYSVYERELLSVNRVLVLHWTLWFWNSLLCLLCQLLAGFRNFRQKYFPQNLQLQNLALLYTLTLLHKYVVCVCQQLYNIYNISLLVINRAHSAFAERSFRHTSATVWICQVPKLSWTYCWDIQKTSQSLSVWNSLYDHCLMTRDSRKSRKWRKPWFSSNAVILPKYRVCRVFGQNAVFFTFLQ